MRREIADMRKYVTLLALIIVVIGVAIAIAWSRQRAKDELRAEIETAIAGASPETFATIERKLIDLAAKHPNQATVLLNLGIAQTAQGKLDEADATFTKVLEINSRDYDAIAERAAIAVARGRADEGLALFDSIPAGEGRMLERLRGDPAIAALRADPRVQLLYEKHAKAESLR